jgi:hypothetical protein
MKLIFLDIDGVLNSQEFWHRHIAAGGRGGLDGIDQQAVRRLNRLVTVSGAWVILSSFWRWYGAGAMDELLHQKGATFMLAGCTPWMRGKTRGEEIARYLAIASMEVTPEAFVILDDDDDMGDLTSHLVRTDHCVGLTDDDCARALTMLGTEQ